MDIEELRAKTEKVVEVLPWLAGIKTKQEYDELMAVMHEAVKDYDANRNLIYLMFPVIEEYENENC